MGFPTEFPQAAISELFTQVKSGSPKYGLVALSIYELAGYGLSFVFGNVQHLLTFNPEDLNKILSILSELNLQDLPKYAEIAEYVVSLHEAGNGPLKIALKVGVKYGASAVRLVTKILAIVKEI